MPIQPRRPSSREKSRDSPTIQPSSYRPYVATASAATFSASACRAISSSGHEKSMLGDGTTAAGVTTSPAFGARLRPPA
jgi:hypothetical protein